MNEEASGADLTRPATPRPVVALVTTEWGEGEGEVTATLRLLAGAAVRHASVEVIHLVSSPSSTRPYADSVFRVHPLPLEGARLLRAGVLEAALASRSPGRLPEAAGNLLAAFEGAAPALPALLARLRPDTIVFGGPHLPPEVGLLGAGEGGRTPRIVVVPLTASPQHLGRPPLSGLLERADAVGWVQPDEAEVLAGLGCSNLRPVGLALPLNRGAVAHALFGVREFDRYVVLLRRFPPGGPRHVHSITHELLRSALGKVSVAEVDGERWQIVDHERTLVLPVGPSRVNLWRLMAHAIATIDVRPPGPLGREALESMLLGIPVVVPDDSAAKAHVKAANGGLWYRGTGELLDATTAIADPVLGKRLGAQGAAWAAQNHRQMGEFVERTRRLVLGA